MSEYLFIGGPADGQRHVVDDQFDNAEVDNGHYVRKVMTSRDQVFVCFTYGPMRSFEILEKLFEGYRRA